MRRILLGILLIAHGLTHASAGIWMSNDSRWWLTSALWWIATVGFIVVGVTVLGAVPALKWWRPIVIVSSVSSLVLIAMAARKIFIAGAVVDFVALFVAVRQSLSVDAAFWEKPRRARVTRIAFALFIGYVAVVTGTRHWFMTWGSTVEEQRASLPGDPLISDPKYRIDHAVTIEAPADSVWQWLAQLGQDRGGFYSYDWLERAFGDRISNADRIHPEWQNRKVGDLIRAVQPDYLGGIFGENVGWRITAMEPRRAMVLEGWGAFVLRPLDERTTRFQIRTRGEGAPTLATIPLAPLGVLIFEPAHFIMERRMMLGIKERAEHSRSM